MSVGACVENKYEAIHFFSVRPSFLKMIFSLTLKSTTYIITEYENYNSAPCFILDNKVIYRAG